MKKFILPIFAAVLAIGFNAFTPRPVHKSTSASALHYFFVNGTTVGNYIGDYDPTVPGDWEQLQDDSECRDNPVALICAKGFETMEPESATEGTNPLKRSE